MDAVAALLWSSHTTQALELDSPSTAKFSCNLFRSCQWKIIDMLWLNLGGTVNSYKGIMARVKHCNCNSFEVRRHSQIIFSVRLLSITWPTQPTCFRFTQVKTPDGFDVHVFRHSEEVTAALHTFKANDIDFWHFLSCFCSKGLTVLGSCKYEQLERLAVNHFQYFKIHLPFRSKLSLRCNIPRQVTLLLP